MLFYVAYLFQTITRDEFIFTNYQFKGIIPKMCRGKTFPRGRRITVIVEWESNNLGVIYFALRTVFLLPL